MSAEWEDAQPELRQTESPGLSPSDPADLSPERDVLDDFLDSDRASASFKTVEVLQCFGRKKRGPVVNRRVATWLADHNLEMQPPIADADYYGSVTVTRGVAPRAEGDLSTGEEATGETSQKAGVSGWILSSLKGDGEELDYLEYGASVDDAISLMRERNRSKLPLFFSAKDRSTLIGTVTLAELAYDQTAVNTKLIEKAIVQVPVVGTNEKLFDWIPTILRHGFIYGKNGDGEIVQIYTIHDVATHLNSIAAMFLRANEIEELLRSVLTRVPADEALHALRETGSLKRIPLVEDGDRYFTDEELSPRGESRDEQHPAETFQFGDYMKCIGHPEIWSKYFGGSELPVVDKERCLRSLNDARLARNSVMHFNQREGLENLIPSFESLAVWLRQVSARISRD